MKKRLAILLLSLILILSFTVTVAAKRNVSLEESYAVKLKELGLFYGVGENDFDLERAPTRIEALIMLIRVLGEEEVALAGTWEHPFTDVPTWADKYVGYAYENKLANGVSLTEFGTTNATSAQYLTFMLRALGYSDTAANDFTWDKPYDLARHIMILPSSVDIENFWRADVAHISYVALGAKLKDSTVTLADKLVEKGVFTRDKYISVTSIPAEKPSEPLTSVEISDKCSDSVFYIVVYAFNGRPMSSGSGFFISEDGYAITNYHVVAGGRFMAALSPDGTMYDRITVVDTYKEQDLALIKIETENVSYLDFGDSTSLKQGQKVYAIGSPQGLENTMSEGIISNPSRIIGDTHYIQISVPISSGSSGGALVDEYGNVIGVTTAGLDISGDLNFVVPIQYADKLDKASSNVSYVWNDTLYPLLSAVYDFGAFTGIPASSASATNYGYILKYNGNDTYDVIDLNDKVVYTKDDSYSFCIEQYGKALVRNGMTHTAVDSSTDRYENGSEYVEIVRGANKSIVITAELKKICYAEAEGLVDAEWYLGVEFVEKETDGDIATYHYKWGEGRTANEINDSINHYIKEICAPAYTLLHSEHDKNGKVLAYLQGNGLLVTLSLNVSDLSVEIRPFNSVTLEKHFEMLLSYVKKNSTSAVNGKYSIVSKNDEDKYMLSYSEKDGLISFAGNVKLPDAEIQAYVRINRSGKGSIEVIFTRSGVQTVYRGNIFTDSFGKDIIPKQTYYNGQNSSADVQTAISVCITVLKRCETNILTETSLTLKKIGFNSLDD